MVLAMHVFWSTAEWARAIAALPCDGPLAERTVIVPRSRVAHQLRKELIRAGHTEALVGTRFATPIAAALDVLGVARAGEEALRPARIAALLRSGLDLHYFRPEVVARTPGWGDAFANTIGELEAAGLGPSDLPGADPRWRDLATLWHALDESAGASWTGARLLAAAARELEASERAWPFGGPTLVTVTDTPSVVWAQFARAVPNATLAMLAGRPLRVRWLERLQELFGSAVRAAVEAARPAALGAQPSEREVMSAFLFEPASVLTDPARPRSSGIDGSVTLEEHAGVEAELESSSDWVRRKVVAGVPLEEIAVLVARSHPVAALLADRLRESGVPVHFASGYPLASTAAGARVIAVLRAMRNHLALDWLAEVLPFLRLSDGEEDGPRHLGRSAAIEIATGLGTIGGHPATPIAAVEWSERIPLRIAALETELSTELEAPDPNASRGRRQQEQLLRNLRGIRPAVDALTGVTRALIEGAPLSRLTEGLCDLIEKWVLAPAEGAPLHAVLRGALAALASDSTCGSLSGNDALDCIEETMGGLGIPAERFGGPAVYVGTPRGAVGLRFESVRVIGLAEGSIPSAPREDPVIPASAKGAVCPWAMNEADVVLAQLHALDRVVRDATREVVLSFARTDFDGTQHEPSSVFIEAGAALARGGTTGAQAIPDVRTLSRLGFAPARQRAREERLALPLGRAAWLDRVASLEHHAHIPSGWREGRDAPVLDLARIHALGSGSEVGPSHGIFGQAGAFLSVPGLDANRPISASALDKLLGCPYRFLLERLLYWNEPDEASVSRSLDALTYGGLFHAVAERFFSEHGAAFGRREESLEHWQERASKIACEVFDHEMEWFPLPGDDVRATQVNRLRSNVQVLLDLDWNQAEARRFVDVERAFGYDDPLRLDCGLYVHGRIDRVDVEGRTTLVRDLKTGRGHPRAGDETEPCLARDVQIGLYSLVTERLAQRWGVPQKVAASYVYVDPATEPERAFRDDYADLRAATAEWLQVARGLLEERSFPKAATNRPCRYCVHQPVCRPSAERAAQVMKAAGGAARSLLDHHAGSREEEG